MGKAFPRRLRCAAALVVLMGLAGCQDKAADAPASGTAPAGSTAGTAGPSGASNPPASAAAPQGNGPAKAATPAATSLSGEALARARTCLACHQVDRKQVGPAYRDVAARFAGNPEADTILANAIRKGGRGQWGAVPMPAQPQVSEAEATELARWILSLKP